ncbi:MAG: transposase [Pirellulales bacterium]
MSRKTATTPAKPQRRQYTDEFKREAVQMMLDGHSAASIAERLGIPDVHMLYRWRATLTRAAGTVGEALDARVKALEAELRRVERERDVLKKALIIFGRAEPG